MSKKLSKREREETVTKGYLKDFLEDQDYVTKSYLDAKLESYVTKTYLDDVLDKRFKEFRKEINEDFKYHIEALTENYMDQLQTLFEGLDHRYVLRKEWEAVK